MALLAFHDVYKRFNTVEVLHGVSFTLDQGTVLGLIGENGSGKSTCMNIVGGVLPLTGGHMTLDGQPYRPGNVRDASKAGIAFIHQELNLFENLSIEENIFINDFPRPLPFVPWILRRRVRDETRRLLDLVELAKNPGTKISQLSQGERQLVEIAKALRTDSRIIIFDEPTTSLTRHECQQLFGIINRLRGREIGVIYISHILDDVLRLADAIVVLRDGQVAASGPAEGTDASQLVRHMVGREIEKLYPTRGVIVSNDNALEVDELSRPGFVRNISLRIRKGEIVGLAGRMGSGRTELARMLFGLDRFSSGRIRVHGREIPRPTPARCAAMGMALVTEDRRGEGLLMPAKIQPNVSVALCVNTLGGQSAT